MCTGDFMKKLFYYILLIFLIVFLLQLIARGYNYSNFRQEFRPTYNASPKNFNKDEPAARLELKYDNRIHDQLREFRNDTNEDTKYNSSCQFGVCVPGGKQN